MPENRGKHWKFFSAGGYFKKSSPKSRIRNESTRPYKKHTIYLAHSAGEEESLWFQGRGGGVAPPHSSAHLAPWAGNTQKAMQMGPKTGHMWQQFGPGDNQKAELWQNWVTSQPGRIAYHVFRMVATPLPPPRHLPTFPPPHPLSAEL